MAGLKHSRRKREAILDYLHSTKSHPTAGSCLLESPGRISQKISLGTVYRNLNLLANQGTGIAASMR